MKRVGVIIYTKKQYRTFIETGFFSLLEDEVEIQFITYSDFSLTHLTFPNEAMHVAGLPRFLSRLGTLFAASNLWLNRFRSRAHFFRAVCTYGKKTDRLANSTMILYESNSWGEIKRFFVRLLASSPILRFLTKIRSHITKLILKRRFEKSMIDLEDFLYVLIPYSGLMSPEFDDLVSFVESKDIASVGIQENWDNLASKTFIAAQPSYFLVWGEQSRAQLRSVQNKPFTQSFIVGSPRFLPYFSKEYVLAEEPKKLNPSPYILVTGTGDGIDDEFLLRTVIDTVSNNSHLSHLRLVYRPHPFIRHSLSENFLLELKARGIVVDSGESAKAVFHHCMLVKNATLVINQFSTILLEALCANVKVLLPTFVSREVKYDYSSAVDEWHHFMGLKLIPNVNLSLSPKEFAMDFLEAATNASKVSRPVAAWMVKDSDSRVLLVDFHKTIIKK